MRKACTIIRRTAWLTATTTSASSRCAEPDRPDVPIFTLSSHTGRYSAYALLYENTFVERPMRFQLGNAFKLLTQPRGLMTLFFVRGKVDATSTAARSTVEELLLAAIDSFLAQPRSTP